MKSIVVLCAIVVVSTAGIIDFYKTANDNLNIEALMKDKTELQDYLDCFFDRKPCGVIPASYLKIIPDAIASGCTRCSPFQKHIANVFLSNIRTASPADYKSFVNKFDPKGIYMEKFLESVKGF